MFEYVNLKDLENSLESQLNVGLLNDISIIIKYKICEKLFKMEKFHFDIRNFKFL